LISEFKGGKDASSKTKVARKRRRVERDEDSSSDDAEIPKPKFGFNNETQKKEEFCNYGIALDLSTTNNATPTINSTDYDHVEPIPSGSKLKIKTEQEHSPHGLH